MMINSPRSSNSKRAPTHAPTPQRRMRATHASSAVRSLPLLVAFAASGVFFAPQGLAATGLDSGETLQSAVSKPQA